jgi:RNA-binding protein
MARAKKAKKADKPVKLDGRATRHLRGLGHALDPLVSIGKNGITDALVAQTSGLLLRHELVKVRVQGEAPVDRKEAAVRLAEATRSALAQILGRTFLLYKPNPEKPRIVLPGPKKKRPAAPVAAARPRADSGPTHAEPKDYDGDGEDEDGVSDDQEI